MYIFNKAMTQLIQLCQSGVPFCLQKQSNDNSNPRCRIEPSEDDGEQISKFYENFLPGLSISVTIRSKPVFLEVLIDIFTDEGSVYKIAQPYKRNSAIKNIFKEVFIYSPNINPLSGVVCLKASVSQSLRMRSQSHTTRAKRALGFVDFESLKRETSALVNCFREKSVETNTSFAAMHSSGELAKAVYKLCHQPELSMQEFMSSQRSHQEPPEIVGFLKEEFSCCRKRIRHLESQTKAFRHIFSHLNSLTGSSIAKMLCKPRGSNLQKLHLCKGEQQRLNQAVLTVINCSGRQTLAIKDHLLGQITIEVAKEDPREFRLRTTILQKLTNFHEFSFIDRYFDSCLKAPVCCRLFTKDIELPAFLQRNRLSISIQTTLRLMSQICCSVHTAWENSNVILSTSDLSTLHITRNLCLKFRNIHRSYVAENFMLLEHKEMLNAKIHESFLSLFQILVFFLCYRNPMKTRSLENRFLSDFQRRSSKKSMMQKQPLEFISELTKPMIGLRLSEICFVLLQFSEFHEELQRPEYTKVLDNLWEAASDPKTNGWFETAERKAEAAPLMSYRFLCSWLLGALDQESLN